MKIFRQGVRWNWIGALVCPVLSGVAFSQTSSATVSASPISSATLQAFRQEQQVLAQERLTLVSEGATPQQIEAWQQQNAPQFAAQQQRAQQMSAESAVQPMKLIQKPNIPADASPALKDFLTTQIALANAHAQIHNQLIQSLPSGATAAQIGQMQQQEMKLFQQQHAADLKLQAQRAQVIASLSANQSMRVPPPLAIPSDATPQMTAFLTTRDQLMREQSQLHNQYLSATPAVQQAAMQQWRQQNAARFQQLQQQAQNLSQADSTPKKLGEE